MSHLIIPGKADPRIMTFLIVVVVALIVIQRETFASMLTFQEGINVPEYAATKDGIGQLTKELANEWACRGVQVNFIAPGYVNTDNTEALRNAPIRSNAIMEHIPMGCYGDPGDFKRSVLFGFRSF